MLCGRQRFGCIILGAPGSGKTTALRDMIRLFSERGYRVGVADERGEISGDGEFDLGPCSDVITGLSKAESAMLLLRGMNPQIIAMDEITQSADADAIRELCCCGVAECGRAAAASRICGAARHGCVQIRAEHPRHGFGTELRAGGAVCINTPVFL